VGQKHTGRSTLAEAHWQKGAGRRALAKASLKEASVLGKCDATYGVMTRS
jgi:hypothetical protein